MTTASVLAFNLGSATLKAASFLAEPSVTGQDAVVTERARVEFPSTSDALADLAKAFDALPLPARTPDIVVHRIVHGGPFTAPRMLDDDTLAVLDDFAHLAPIHQPPALELARAARRRWPSAQHGAGFDTLFHAHLAPWSRRLPVPADLDAGGVRRYGFHGYALASALRQLTTAAAGAVHDRVVIAHLGGGCSVAAIQAGRSVDTTMGMTPFGGVVMPTRTGDIDPGVVFHLLRQGCEPAQLERRLAQESGLAGIAGHGDMRRLLEDPRPEAALAIEQFVMRIAQAIAAMAVAIGGLDHLVFSGGSGARSPILRMRIAARLDLLGVVLDPVRNSQPAPRIDGGGRARVWRFEVDEELELAESVRAWAMPMRRT